MQNLYKREAEGSETEIKAYNADDSEDRRGQEPRKVGSF